MASVGLTVRNSPIGGDLSLADTLAKSIFGDPEGEMKARALASQVAAHQAYTTKLGADTRLVGVKTQAEQDILDAERNAGPLVGNAAAAAVPMPVPVEVPRASAPGTTGYGPQPLDQPKYDADKARYDALVAQEHALGRILVHGNPEQVAKGVNTNYGGAILSGAASNPAIVNPDSLRLASTLYTGSAPTTSTVMTSGDYAGVDAAARQKILEERGKPPAIVTYRDQPGHEVLDASGNPVFQGLGGTAPTPIKPNTTEVNKTLTEITTDPTTGKTVAAPVPGAPAAPPEIKTIESGGVHFQLIPDETGREVAHLIPGQPPSAQKPNTFEGPNKETYLAVPDPSVPGGFRGVPMAGVAEPLPPVVNVDPSKPPMTRDAAGLHPIPGTPAAPASSASIYDQGLTPVAADNKFIGETVAKLYNNQPVSREEALQYAQSWSNTYATKYAIEMINGAKSLVPIEQEKPSPFPRPEVVLSKAGVDPATVASVVNQPVIVPSPQAPPPQANGGQPPVAQPPVAQPPVAQGGPGPKIIPLEKAKPPEMKADQAKDRVFVGALRSATSTLDKFKAGDLPNVYIESLVAPQDKNNQNLLTRWQEANIPSGKDQEYGSAVNLWLSNELYKLSGAAISEGEFARGMRGYVPRSGDTPDLIAEKAQRRHDFIAAVADNAFQGDEDAKQKFYAETIRRGQEIFDGQQHGTAPSKTGAPPQDDVPPKSYTDQGGTAEGWKRMKPEKRSLFP